MNALHLKDRTHIKTVMSSWSNDSYEKIPFTCDSNLSDSIVRGRLCVAVKKRHPSSHFGGCGYSCDISEFHRETPTTGFIVLMHYQGIGD